MSSSAGTDATPSRAWIAAFPSQEVSPSFPPLSLRSAQHPPVGRRMITSSVDSIDSITIAGSFTKCFN